MSKVFYPCRSCKYFRSCGDYERTEPCEGREPLYTMSDKEYKNACDRHITAEDITPSLSYRGLFGYPCAYLTDEAKKALREDIKERKECYNAVELPGSNKRATARKTNKGEQVLTSYYTDVCKIYRKRFYKLWEGYTATTLKHVNEFLTLAGYQTINKRQWIEAPLNHGIALEATK